RGSLRPSRRSIGARRVVTSGGSNHLLLLGGKPMGFKRSEADDLLVTCHRRCCVCHRFCGFKTELHHIEQRSESEDDSLENAIPLCFECHAEVQLYNDKHPRGRKFHPEELRSHKKQWLAICKEQPALAFSSARASNEGVGPLQSLIDEMEYNLAVAAKTGDN